MTTGDVVSIFQKPLTGGDYEGEATLIRKERSGENTEDWTVRFSDGMEVRRKIFVTTIPVYGGRNVSC